MGLVRHSVDYEKAEISPTSNGYLIAIRESPRY